MLTSLVLACGRPAASPSTEFQAAMQLYEDTVSQTLDTTYRHPDFQKVAAAMAQVPTANEREHRTAQRILESIRAAQQEVRDQAVSLEAARKASEAAAAAAAAASERPGGVQGAGGWPSAPPSPRSSYEGSGSSGAERPGFDRAADRARLSNTVRERQDAIKRHNEREAEVRARMKQRLNEKVEERMNTPLDEGHWKVEETKGGPRLRTRVEVKREEVE